MMVNVAINGFGRIGRMVFRAAHHDKSINIVAVNDLTDPATLAHLLKYDSVHGRFSGKITTDNGNIVVNRKKIKVFAEKDPSHLPWKKMNIDVVVESTGFFLTQDLASLHLKAGAKKVILSAPGKSNDIKTIVVGVNEKTITKNDKIISNASCTTNCFAPLVKILHKQYHIQHGFMVTAHGYTSSQKIVDGPHKDLRRARHAALNIIPTSSGAAKAVGQVIPEIGSCLHSSAIRVPVADGSLVYFVCSVKKKTSPADVNALLKKHAENMPAIIEYNTEEIVSSDILGNPHSCIFDSLRTEVEGNLIKVEAWYDNEWGYSNRMIDLIKKIG